MSYIHVRQTIAIATSLCVARADELRQNAVAVYSSDGQKLTNKLLTSKVTEYLFN